MTTTHLSYVSSAEYTWDTAAMTWDSDIASVRVFDRFCDVISYTFGVGEEVIISEGVDKAFTRVVPETLGVVESLANTAGKIHSESLGFSESRAALIGQNVLETLTIDETLSTSTQKLLTEMVSIDELGMRMPSLMFLNTLNLVETADRTTVFYRDIFENFGIAEGVTNVVSLEKSEQFAISDLLRRMADMVVSDMILSSAENMTLDDFALFMGYGNVPGYQVWRNFVPGDYTYREAMVRVVLESSNSDRGLLTGLQMAVDVPDVIDHGTATVADAEIGIEVTYNRQFHIIPEITLAARGGTGNPTIPEFYGSPSTTSFRVRLRDSITGAFVTGKFTWAAHGY